MKSKRPICLLCIILCFCLLICGCGKANDGDNETSGEQATDTENKEDTSVSDPDKPMLGGTVVTDFAGKMFHLTPDNFLDFFHYRIESVDQGGEYDVLSYSLALNASSDDISPYVNGLSADVTFDVKIRYVKEYTENGLIYDTLTYSCHVSGESENISGTVDISQIPVFKRGETDTEHKKFTVLSVTPKIEGAAGHITYSTVNHTYAEEVTYDTVPDFEVVANENCIAVYMVPKNNDCLYDDLTVEIELGYTYDTDDVPEQFINYYGGRLTIEGNLGGYGQFLYQIENGQDKMSRVVVSVVGIGGSVIRSKGFTALDFAN